MSIRKLSSFGRLSRPCRRARAHTLQQPHHRRASSTKTYYDSQSGMHVPIHDENEIYVYKHWINPYLQLYKNSDDAFEAKEEFEELASNSAYAGVFFSSPILHPRDERNLETLLNIAPKDFCMFVPVRSNSNEMTNPNVVVVFNNNDTALADHLKGYRQKKIRTAIYLSNDDQSTTSSVEPFELATEIASIMDASLGGSDYVLVSSSLSDDDDYVIRLCEELSYLDVPGPTMKSRLMLDCGDSDEDLIDEIMMIGVNKFVVREDEQLIQSVAQEHGKKLVKASFS